MFCNQCGKEIPDGTTFCPNCGAKQEIIEGAQAGAQPAEPTPAVQPMPQPQQVQPAVQPMPGAVLTEAPKEKKGGMIKILIPVAAVAVVLVVLLAVLLFGGKKSNGVMEYAENTLIYNYYSESFVNLQGQSEEVDDVYSYYTSGNGAVTVFITDDGELIYIDEKFHSVSIADDVYTVYMSLTGENFAYVVDDNDDYCDTTLYLYNVKSGKSTKIDTGVYYSLISLSPNGKTVAYLKNYEGYTDNTLYLSVGGKDPVKVDKDGCYPIAVSDNGKNFFYVNEDDKLYYYNGKDSEKIETNVSGVFLVNSTVSELLFDKNGKTYYYTPKMEEPLKVAGDSIDFWVHPGYADSNENTAPICYTGMGTIIGKESLKDMVFYADGYLYWMNKKGTEATKIVSSSYLNAYQLSMNGNALLYIRNGELYKVSKFNEDMVADDLYDEEYLEHFVASADLSKIYLVTDDDELLYYKSAKKVEKISNDFTYEYDNIAYCDALGKICYVEDDDLYTATTTSKSKELIQEDVYSVCSYMGGVGYTVYDEDEYLYSAYYLKKKEPILLSEYEY